MADPDIGGHPRYAEALAVATAAGMYSVRFWLEQLPAMDALEQLGASRDELIKSAKNAIRPSTILRWLEYAAMPTRYVIHAPDEVSAPIIADMLRRDEQAMVDYRTRHMSAIGAAWEAALRMANDLQEAPDTEQDPTPPHGTPRPIRP